MVEGDAATSKWTFVDLGEVLKRWLYFSRLDRSLLFPLLDISGRYKKLRPDQRSALGATPESFSFPPLDELGES